MAAEESAKFSSIVGQHAKIVRSVPSQGRHESCIDDDDLCADAGTLSLGFLSKEQGNAVWLRALLKNKSLDIAPEDLLAGVAAPSPEKGIKFRSPSLHPCWPGLSFDAGIQQVERLEGIAQVRNNPIFFE